MGKKGITSAANGPGTPNRFAHQSACYFTTPAVALLWFAVEGGEYGTREMLAQHERRAALERDVKQLQREVDSLQHEKTAVLRDDAVLERIAREQYGMLRGGKEILFWMNNDVPLPDSGAARDTLSRR